MKKAFFSKYKLVFVLFIFAIIAVVFFISNQKATRAVTLDNVEGFAYNDTYGFISFNCIDYNSGEDGSFPYTFPFELYHNYCLDSSYGVDIGDDGYFTGNAWNPTLGWIDFAPATSSPPFFNTTTYEVSGYAYNATAGWIDLNNLTINSVTGDFHGTATTENIGDIRLNCADDSSCGSIDHKVIHHFPIIVEALSAPNWSQSEACDTTSKQAIMKWQLTQGSESSYQESYQIIIDTDPVVDDDTPYWDSGQLDGGATQYACPNAIDACDLDYGTEYYFWVKFWDDRGEAYGWTQFDHNLAAHTLSEDNGSTSQYTFATYQHEFPDPYFSWDLEEWVVGDVINFSDASQYYTSGSPASNPQLCSDALCDYLWSSDIAFSSTTDVTSASSSIVFYQGISGSVFLETTDPEGYACSTSSPVFEVTFDLPLWKEIKAQ